MSLFKIMPHSMIGTLYQDDYTKVVKLRLKKNKRLPKHQQEGYNVFIIATDGRLTAEVNEEQKNSLGPGDFFQLSDNHSFSLLGENQENPFLYFIVPKTQDLETKVSPGRYLGCCYSDDLIKFMRYQLTSEEPEMILNSPGDELIVLCYAGEATVTLENSEKKYQYRFMSGDILHFDARQSIKISKKETDALLLVAHLRLA